MRSQVLEAFEAEFGRSPQFMIRAPGRANLIGEHTDYNDGFVMPLAVDRALYIAAAPRPDDQITLKTLDFDGQVQFSLADLKRDTLPHWSQHVRGAWWLLAQKGFDLPGADVVIGSDIPMGVGMSSSAAIEVGFIETALALIDNTDFSPSEKALMAVEVEHQFVGVPSGVMDQMASAAAIDGTAMLLDCRSLETTAVPIPDSVRVVLINSMKQRELVASAYAERRRQCEEAAQTLGVPALRDATLEMVDAKLEGVHFRRARHVVTENERTLAMQTALGDNDLIQAGDLIQASHRSLRDDYETSIRELDVLSEIATAHDGCYGARIMGGGFGGCAVSLVDATAIDDFQAVVTPAYREQTNLTPEFYVCKPSAGSGVERF